MYGNSKGGIMVRHDKNALTTKQLSVLNAINYGCSNVLNVGLWADFTADEQAVMNDLIVACHRILRERGEYGKAERPDGGRC